MRACTLVAGLAIILTAASASAQPESPAGGEPSPGAETFEADQFIGRRTPGMLRASDFVGRDVYGPDDRVLGEVEDVLFGPDGRMFGLVLEIDRTLGIGERKIGVPMHAIRIDPAATATTGSLGGLPPSTATGLTTRESNRISSVVYPERIILPISPESLRTAPVFED